MNTEENKARIGELITTPPLARSRRVKALDWTRNIAAVVAFVALALGLWTQSEQNSQTRSNQVTVCLESNKVRAQVADLWQYIIDQSRKANAHPTAKQTTDLNNFEQRVNKTYAPRKC